MTYYFYDLETSGINPKWQRIMQFAGQRTDENFQPIGEPDNWLVKLTPEVLPEPEAILITGITPQKTLEEGMSEDEFVSQLMSTVFTPDTTAMGFNTLRFDDEFIRYTLWRNFADPYEREWSDRRSRWDIVDLVRMTRALRPEGINWPVTDDGKPTNRLEMLSEANGLEHSDAHDALSDVVATIGVATLIKQKQPKLFEHLRSIASKQEVKKFIASQAGMPMVHSSSRFSSDYLSTSVVSVFGAHPSNQNAVFAFDLRHSPKKFAELSVEELAERLFTPAKELSAQNKERLPVKAIHLNKSPALAPLGVLDVSSQERIKLNTAQIETHYNELRKMKHFGEQVAAAFENEQHKEETDPDASLYAGFLNDSDRKLVADVRRKKGSLADFHPQFADPRLDDLLLRYKARNFPESLSRDETILWEQYRAKRLSGGLGPAGISAFANKLQKLATDVADKNAQFLLEELQLYAESIAPYDNEELL